MSTSQLADICVTEDEVIDAIGCLTPHKSDSSGISTALLRNTASVVSECVAALFTAIIRHGYMPKCLRDSVLLPIPKTGISDSYRPISLAHSFLLSAPNI